MRHDYARAYRDLHDRHHWWRAREALVLRELRRWSRRPGHERILDVGCGDGLLFERLAPFGEVRGVEPHVPTSPDRRHLPIHHGELDDSYQPDQRFTLILMLDVLEHMTAPERTLERALELLEPDGVVLITVPAFNALWTAHDDINAHQVRYTKRSFADLADRAGLKILKQKYFFHWVAGAKLLLRLKERLLPATSALETVPAAPINRALLALSLAEQRLAPDLPFGSSLLVVATHRSGE